MNAIEQLKSVLCDQEGKCCIRGSDADRAIVDRALEELTTPQQAEAVPPGFVLVPVEPTPEIVAVMAVQEASGSINGTKTIGMAGAVAAYDAMLAAAQGEKP